MSAYHEGPYLEELYTEYGPLLEAHDFDPAPAGAERLGLEASALIAPADQSVVTNLLFDEDLMEALTGDMGGHPDSNRTLLLGYRSGFRDTGHG